MTFGVMLALLLAAALAYNCHYTNAENNPEDTKNLELCTRQIQNTLQVVKQQMFSPAQRMSYLQLALKDPRIRRCLAVLDGFSVAGGGKGQLRGSLSMVLRALAFSAGLSYAQRHRYMTVHVRNFPSVIQSPIRMYLTMGDMILDRSAELLNEFQGPRQPKSWRTRFFDEIEWWRKELSRAMLGGSRKALATTPTSPFDRDRLDCVNTTPAPEDLK